MDTHLEPSSYTVDPATLPVALRPPTPELEALGERIALLAAQISAATYQLLVLIREFDEQQGWGRGFDGFRNCAHWLSWRTGLAPGVAREKVRVARALGGLPKISEAMRRGKVSYSKVRAMTRVATAENEEELLTLARYGTAAQLERVVRATRAVTRDAERRQEVDRHERRYLQTWVDADGSVVIRGRLEPEAGQALLRALEAAADVLYDEERERQASTTDGVRPKQRRADAVGRVAEAALAGGLDQGTRGDRYQVVVHVDAEVLADPESPPEAGGQSILEGGDVSAETSRRIACEANRVIMTHDSQGNVLDVGRKTRAVAPALRRALEHRDQGCRFPGCGVKFCDAHHVKHWAEGGETKLENLVLLCRKHHRSVHEGGLRVEADENGAFRFLKPDGSEIQEAPPLPELGKSSWFAMLDPLIDGGVDPDAMGGWPEWDGSRLDLAAGVDMVLHPVDWPGRNDEWWATPEDA